MYFALTIIDGKFDPVHIENPKYIPNIGEQIVYNGARYLVKEKTTHIDTKIKHTQVILLCDAIQ